MPLQATAPLAARRLTGELMDDPALDPAQHAAALRALARLNAFAGGHRILWPPLLALAAIPGHTALRILDVATGSGDIPIRLMRLARRRGLHFTLDACDLSETALDLARARAARAGVDVNFFRHDALSASLPGEYDVVMCSLFLHHLHAEDAVELLYRMRCAARRLVLVSDLVRSRAGLTLAWAASRLFTRSRIVHEDAVRSVRAAFTPDELAELAASAGLEGAIIAPHWPQRMLMVWSRS
ncbi:MAG: methyltransferase domain-containing protein [Phycisphaerales bacterium]